MGDAIVVNVQLHPQDILETGKEIGRQLTKSLESGVGSAKEAGRKIGSALNAGIEAGLRDAARLRRQLDAAVSPDQRHRTMEAKELAHVRRIEALQQRSAATLQAIESRKQAQLDVLRERMAQREIERQRRMERAARDGAGGVDFLRSSVSRLSGAFVGLAAFGAVVLFRSIAEGAQQAAINIDRQVSSLRALTGSAELAQKRFAALVAISQRTPGLTTDLAATLDVQLRILNVTEKTIDRLLPAIGRLNAISPLGDPQRFAQNLIQLVTQNFERQDLKELVGQSPLAGELIKQIFNVDSPTNAKAIRAAAERLGIRSVEYLAIAFSMAAETNPKLKNAVESLGTQFEKLRDRLNVAIAPVGAVLSQIELQLGQDLVSAVERFGPVAAQVFRQNRVEIIETVRAAGDLLVTLGKLTFELANIGGKDAFIFIRDSIREVASMMRTLQDLAELAAAGISFTFNSIVGGVAAAVQKALGVIGVEFETLNNLVKDTFGAAERAFQRGQQGGINTRQLAERFKLADQFVNLDPTRARALTIAVATGDLSAIARLSASPQPAPPPSGGSGGGGAAGGGGSGGRGAAKQSEVSQLVDQVKELNREVEVLRNATGREFNLQIRQDELQETKKTLEKIRELERELNFLPTPLASGTEEERRKTLEAVRKGPLPTRPLPPPARLNLEFTPDPLTAEQVARFERLNELEREGRTLQQQQNALRLDEVRLQNQIELGVLTEAEGRRAILGVQRAHRDEILRALEAQREFAVSMKDLTAVSQIDIQIEQVKLLGVELSNAQRFARGFGSAIGTVGDAFERLGQDVSRALTNTRDLLNGLKQAVLNFFNDLLGQSLQNLLRSVFAPLIGALGGLNPAAAGAAGGLFRTPSTFPASVGASAFQSIATAIAGSGGGLSAPPSISALSQFFGPSVPRTAGVIRGGLDEFFGAGVPRTAGRIGGGFSFGSIGKSFAAAAPLLGLSLGGSLGGQSIPGQILGSAGGLLAGGAVAGFSGALGATATAFFTNPFTIAIGAGLLISSVLLGRAKQRRKDEEAAGQFLGQAFQAVEQLRAGILSDQIEGSQARSILESQIVGPFIQQINSLKTASVRRDWVKNQVPEIRARFEANVVPLIAEQERRRADAARFAATDSRLIPQFAGGGLVPGRDFGRDSVLSMLRPNEMVLTVQHQAAIRSIAGADVFNRVGVPGASQQVGPAQAFQFGGTAQPSSFSNEPLVINLDVQMVMGRDTATNIFIAGGSTEDGRQVIINQIDKTRLNRGLR